MEGLFSKTFRSDLQPVEVAKRLMREMDAGRTVGPGGVVWVPNRFVVTLGPEDATRFSAAQGPISTELARVVRDHAAERKWGLMGPPDVTFETDPQLKRGEFRCEGRLAEGTGSECTPILPPAAELHVFAGDRGTKTHPLGAVTTIGRAETCDICLPDPSVSRRHAEIRKIGSTFVLTDLGSTNGTMVNGARIAERALTDGDRITVGRTDLEFRESG